MIALIILIIVIAIVAWAISNYNSLQSLNVNIDEAQSQIDVQLQRRADLIPNLVEIVKGYANHEKSTLTEVIRLRNNLVSGSLPEKMEANTKLTQDLHQLFAVAENYPDLKADKEFMSLQEELVNTEDKVGYARQLYNSCVGTYNRALVRFPGSLIANMVNMNKRDYLKVDEDKVKEAPKISF